MNRNIIKFWNKFVKKRDSTLKNVKTGRCGVSPLDGVGTDLGWPQGKGSSPFIYFSGVKSFHWPGARAESRE